MIVLSQSITRIYEVQLTILVNTGGGGGGLRYIMGDNWESKLWCGWYIIVIVVKTPSVLNINNDDA